MPEHVVVLFVTKNFAPFSVTFYKTGSKGKYVIETKKVSTNSGTKVHHPYCNLDLHFGLQNLLSTSAE